MIKLLLRATEQDDPEVLGALEARLKVTESGAALGVRVQGRRYWTHANFVCY